MRNKLQSLLSNLNQGLIARESTVKLALLTLLAGENILLVGPPGTGKSFIARRMADSLAGDDQQGDDYFEYLLTKFSTPEEIFGPLSISELKKDRFKRNTAGYLPTVKTAFLDEIFKSSSSILNSLLTILNERVYHNGAEVQPVPLRALIAASNELPTEQTELSALYDRFLVRVFVDYVPEESRQHFFSPFEPFHIQPELCISDAELAQIAKATAQVEIPTEVVQAIQQIWIKHKEAFKEDRRESLSDRRLVKVIQLLRVSAVTNGRTKMDLSDVLLLKDCLWNHQDNAEQVLGIIQKELQRVGATLVDDTQDVITKSNKPNIEAPSTPKKVLAAYKRPSKKPVVKGFAGSGTEQDPLLVQTLQDLADLARAEVGLQGYYFKQTANIDISNIKTWSAINFDGHYDGNGYSIIDDEKHKRCLFDELIKATIYMLVLEGVSLARQGKKTIVDNCRATDFIFRNENQKNISYIESCIIKFCHSDGGLISDNAIDCSFYNNYSLYPVASVLENSLVKFCQIGTFVVGLDLYNTRVLNCSVFLSEFLSGCLSWVIASLADEKSLIENCYIEGVFDVKDEYFFDRLVDFNSCANLKKIVLRKLIVDNKNLEIPDNFIKYTELKNMYPSLQEDISCCNIKPGFYKGSIGLKDMDIELIPVFLFNQRYFEKNLGWDFDSTWIWDEQENRPALRHVGLSSLSPAKAGVTNDKPLVDVFHKQLEANIWI